MPQPKPTNPFYIALVIAGIAFALTACAFVVTMGISDPRQLDESSLAGLMDQHGVWIMLIELALLAVLMFAAMATDGFWTRRFEQSQHASNEFDK
jgi:hypothetical protein